MAPEVLPDAAAGAASDAVCVARELHALLQHQYHSLHRYHTARAEEAALRVLHLRQERTRRRESAMHAHGALMCGGNAVQCGNMHVNALSPACIASRCHV